jgi:membrane protein implicated in regulation of membrane protease activity
MEAAPDHRYELPEDSIWPVALAIVVGGGISWAIFNPWAVPVSAFLTFVVLCLWFWRGNEPTSLNRELKKPENLNLLNTETTKP